MTRVSAIRQCRVTSTHFPLMLLAVLLTVAGASCRSMPGMRAQRAPAVPELLELHGDLGVHDPVIAREGDTFYVFCTGRVRRAGVLPIRCSKDMYNWTLCGAVLDSVPAWARQEIPRNRGDAWAPDISYYDGKWHLYYSVSSFGSNDSAIGLATNETLDPNSPEYQWVDQGLVVRSRRGQDNWNAIDPQLIVESKNKIWLCWGSFWSGIKMRRIDPATGKPSTQDTTLYSLAGRPRSEPDNTTSAGEGAIEAPFAIRHDGYWYLFASFDRCCQGARSTYNIRVGRSKKVTGPYVDRDGKSMLEGGGTMVLEAAGPAWRGPGHEAVLQDVSGDYLIFHAYNGQNGRSELKISTMVWKDGWPEVAALP